MPKTESSALSKPDLRSQAEKLVRAQREKKGPPNNLIEAQRLLFELEVHQIELEIQNEELRRSRSENELLLTQYTNLFDFAPVGYVTLGAEISIQSINFSGAELLGFERSFLIGRQISQFVPQEDRSAFAAFLDDVLVRTGKGVYEGRLLSQRAEPVFVLIEAVASDDKPLILMAIIDVSLRKKLEEKLQISRDELTQRAEDLNSANINLEAANLKLAAFNSSVAHDLRTPLTVMGGYCQLIQEVIRKRRVEEGDIKDLLDEICCQIDGMDRLITTLLNFSQLTHVKLKREQVDLSELVSTVATMISLSAPGRRVDFTIEPGLTGQCDPNLMRIVITNLLENAWKFTGNCEKAFIEFGRMNQAGPPVWYVRDNGEGFPMEEAENIFIPFHRLRDANDFTGFGIGLATVGRIIQHHGGRVWAEGMPGAGASFFFTLGEE